MHAPGDPEFSGEGGLATVAVCDNVLDAALLQCRLQAEGIPAFVADAGSAGAYPLAGFALGSLRLQVPGGRAHAAKQVLARLAAGDYALDEAHDGEDATPP